MEKAASCWLNAPTLKRYQFDVTKGQFRDGCAKGSYTHIRHNDIRDSFANLLNEVCDVKKEPCLQALQGETFANRSTTIDDDERLNIKANGLFDS